jgi:DNA-binding CsgD family transcriptional regulator
MNEPLAERETKILRLAADGYANGEIAARLSLSLNTVKWYSKRIYEKLAVEKRAQTLSLLGRSNQPIQPAQPVHNLPNPLITLVGRRAEIDAVKQLLKISELHAQLGKAEFDRGWQAGRTLTIAKATAMLNRYSQ